MGFVHPGHNPFTNPRSMHASSQHGYSSSMNGHGYSTPHGVDHRRSRSSAGIVGLPMGGAILPTPDPTVGSCVSEEDKDVALQLMRLGDMSNVSHGRTSASTLDDAFSGKAEVASSTGATSDSESDSGDDADFDVGQPPARRQKLLDGSAGAVARTPEARSALPTSSTLSIDRQGGSNGKPKAASAKPKASKPKPSTAKTAKANGKMTTPGMPMSPASAPASRKPSIVGASPMMMAVVDGAAAVAATPGDDQPDLSTKPRCQRCRKSKKGCDRQRPCGRCRDAGLSAEQCISEDEGNGRKGRYGRHMGVPIKATSAAGPTAMTPGHAEPSPAPPMGMPAPVAVQSGAGVAAGPGLLPAAHISMSVDKKKRKR